MIGQASFSGLLLLALLIIMLCHPLLIAYSVRRRERKRNFITNLRPGDRVRFRRNHWIPTGIEVTTTLKGTIVCPPVGQNAATVMDDQGRVHYVVRENILMP